MPDPMPDAIPIVSPPWSVRGTGLILRFTPRTLGFAPDRVWSPTPTRAQRIDPLPLPARLCLGTRDGETQGAKLTPPPFVVMLSNPTRRLLLCISADPGWHGWNFMHLWQKTDHD